MFMHFDRIHERVRQTDGQTPHDGIGCACIASRGNNEQRILNVTMKTVTCIALVKLLITGNDDTVQLFTTRKDCSCSNEPAVA